MQAVANIRGYASQSGISAFTAFAGVAQIMWIIKNISLLGLVVILAPSVYPELKVKPPAPITGDPIEVEDEAYLAHFSKESKYGVLPL